MYKLIRPILFRFNPTFVHESLLFIGSTLSKLGLAKLYKPLFTYENKRLEQKIKEVTFKNPIGLGGGFDKDAKLTEFLPNFGFGFLEVGSITYGAYEGNKKPWLIRFPKDKSILVNFGLKGKGAKSLVKRLDKKRDYPLGINIAATNKKYDNEEETAEEFVKTYKILKDYGAYHTINISCPNAFGGESFCNATNIKILLDKLKKVDIKKPLFLKLKIDLTGKEADAILKVVGKYKFVTGFIVGNLTKNRKGMKSKNIPSFGGLSGKPCYEKSLKLIKHIHKKTKGKYVIIGLGGVFDAEDAYKMLKAGASLVQLITGMIYNGPETVKNINKGLIKRLNKEGYKDLPSALKIWHTKKS